MKLRILLIVGLSLATLLVVTMGRRSHERAEPTANGRASSATSPARAIAGTASIPRLIMAPGTEGGATGTAAPAEAAIDPTTAELRLPLVTAIRTPHKDPAAKRAAMLRAIRGSGPSREPWTSDAGAVFASWREAMPAEIKDRLTLPAPSCYRAGCEVEVAFPDAHSQEVAATTIRNLAVADRRHGGRVMTPAVAGTGGQFVVSWLMLRPEPETEQAAQ